MDRRASHHTQSATGNLLIMSVTRRSFVKLAAATALLASSGPLKEAWAQTATAGVLPLSELPSLDGQLLFDDSDRQAVADDFGRHVHRLPIAVLRPGSVNDILRMVTYANKHGLKIAMRGRGHSSYGQAQVEAGIVIDSSALSDIQWRGDDAIDVQPGALWGDVAKRTLQKGLTPPVIPDAHILSVGGTLSVGGIGETSYRFGAQVDHVRELDVVTGAGDLMTCSPKRNEELFRMVLAGLGQCGIIVRARLHLIPAPKSVTMRVFTYDDLEIFLADQAHLSTVEDVGPLTSRLVRNVEGRWQISLMAGSFLDQDDVSRTPSWPSGLRYKAAVPPTRTSYWDYLDRLTPGINQLKATGGWLKPNPSLALQMPDSAVRPFLKHVLSTPEAFIGIRRFDVFPMITARFAQPLTKMPAGPLAYGVRLLRTASADNAPDHIAMLAANQMLLPRLQAAGGKIYPPYCPILSHQEWQGHYGPETWPRFAAAKKRFDPNNVLTPGAGIF